MGRNPVAVFEKYRARLGPTFTFHFGGVKEALVSSDPVVIEHVLKGNRENYEKSQSRSKHMVDFQGQGLVNIHGEAWLRQRRLLAHGFRASHLMKVLPMQQDVLHELMTSFDRDARLGPVDIHQQMVRFTLRLVGRSMFGRSMPDAELERIGDTISAIQAYILREVVQPWKMPWFRFSGQSEAHQQLRHEGDAIALQHIQARLKEGVGDNDFLRILTEARYHDTGEPMSEADGADREPSAPGRRQRNIVQPVALDLLLAGETPSLHPASSESEIDTVIGNDAVDVQNLHQLSATMRVMDEALRLYPPFWMIDRIALQDDEAGRRPHSGRHPGHSVHSARTGTRPIGRTPSRSIRAGSNPSGANSATPSPTFPSVAAPGFASATTWP